MAKILITGASGKLGRLVVEKLLKKTGPSDLAVFIRNPESVGDFQKQGVEVYKGEYNDYASLLKAFQGKEKLFFISGSEVPLRNAQHENVVNAAKEAKVHHIFYTSFQRRREDQSSPIAAIADTHIRTENWIKASGLTYTILKHGLYTDIIATFMGEKWLESGMIVVPTGQGKASFALRDDLADGAVAVLTTPGHENKSYEFAARESWSFTDLAAILSKITGKDIVHVSPGLQDYTQSLVSAGIPEMYAVVLSGFAQGIEQGEFDFPDETLSDLIGRKSFDMNNYLKSLVKI